MNKEINWDGMTEDEQTILIINKKLPESFWVEHWDKLTEWQRVNTAHFQLLSELFWMKHWDELTDEQRGQVLIHQPSVFDWDLGLG